jgi:hypothetical protein
MSFGESNPSQAHSCLSRKIYTLFVRDGEFGSNTEDISSDEEELQQAAISTQQSVSSPNAPSSPASNRQLIMLPGRNISPPSAATSAIAVSTSSRTAAALQRNSSLSLDDIPPAIWTTEWVPIEGRHTGLYSIETLLETVCGAANSGIIWVDLEVRGPDVRSLAAQFKAMLGDAVDSGDFSSVLSPERSFTMLVAVLIFPPPSLPHLTMM